MGKHRRDEQDFHFDYHFFVRLGSVAKILFPRLEWSALFLVATLVFSIASEVLTFMTGMVPGQMYKALSDKNQSEFWHSFFKGSLSYVGKCLLLAMKSFTSWQLYLSWRKNAVTKLQERYFRNRVYYKINCIDDLGIDNPDQRITQDIERICNQLAINILPAILIGPFVVAFYTYKTYISAGGFGIAIIYGYFVVGTIVNKFLISPMVTWNARVEKAEGDFSAGEEYATWPNSPRLIRVTCPFEGRLSIRLPQAVGGRTAWTSLKEAAARRSFLCDSQGYPSPCLNTTQPLPPSHRDQASRYKHVSIRNNAESVALYEAETFEQFECNRIFMVLWWRQFKYLWWKLPNLFWQQLFDYYGAILSYAIQFIPIFITGIYDGVRPQDLAGIISNNAFVYIYLVNSFTRITDVALSTGEMAGILQRVAELNRVCRHADRCSSSSDEGYDNFAADGTLCKKETDKDMIYDIQDVSFSLPQASTEKILEGLTLSIYKGARIWITGPSGCGKTSLLRVLAGLWEHETGVIRCAAKRGQILRLSQVPYFPSGHLSLFQQISFPAAGIATSLETNDNDYASIAAILNTLKLGWLIGRCEGLFTPVEFEWQDTLTPGEQQRLAFARVLYQRPELVFLDESTSSIGVDIEEHMYQLLISNNISFVSVGHRPSLSKFHDVELHLDGQGGYTIRSLGSFSAASTTDADSEDLLRG